MVNTRTPMLGKRSSAGIPSTKPSTKPDQLFPFGRCHPARATVYMEKIGHGLLVFAVLVERPEFTFMTGRDGRASNGHARGECL